MLPINAQSCRLSAAPDRLEAPEIKQFLSHEGRSLNTVEACHLGVFMGSILHALQCGHSAVGPPHTVGGPASRVRLSI